MIELDRQSATPVSEQLAEQLRYLVATGHYRPGEGLPSTREMGRRLELSFHTVRKAYHVLEAEGLLESKQGSGFRIRQRTALPPAERIERGAALLGDALRQLLALGLSEAEAEYLFAEQLQLLARPGASRKVLFASAFQEWAAACAEQAAAILGETVRPVTLGALAHHPDADLILAPHRAVQRVLAAAPRADLASVAVTLPSDVLDQASRLAPTRTLGIAARNDDAAAPLAATIRSASGFGGQILAFPADASRKQLAELIGQVDLLVYTPGMRRKLRPLLGDTAHAEATPVLERAALERVRV